ncbi:MAG: MBL fold metallo-hydrolase [Ornithinimicrobium sp.]
MSTPTTATFTSGGQPVTVHAIQTGTITIKRSHHTCRLPERTPLPIRVLAILADRRFSAPMPIWTFAIEHPQGLVLIDAGATPSYNNDESWAQDPRGGRLIRSFIKIDVKRDQALPVQLNALGLDPMKVDHVVLTHQHIDHTASLPAFANAMLWTTKAEDDAAEHIGAFAWRWRTAETETRYVDTDPETNTRSSADPGPGLDIFADGSLRAFHAPGHTPGSITVRFRTDTTEMWFTGDISFTADHMKPTAPTAGIHTDMNAVRRLQTTLASKNLILPSHDWTNADRLKRRSETHN